MRRPRVLLFGLLAVACIGLALLFWKLGDPATPTSSSHTTHPVNQGGEFPRVQVATSERIQVELGFSRTQPGDHIAVAAEDGGFVDGSRSAALTVNDQRRVRFAFDVRANEGVHHVTVATQGGQNCLLDFWAGPMPILRSTAVTR